jgi:thioredoxin-dependent peroxiredoxin
MREPLKVGERAPEFRLPTDEDKSVELSDFRGKHVVLFFFPKALTPG